MLHAFNLLIIKQLKTYKMESTSNERVRQVMQYYCKTASEFAEKVGITRQEASKLTKPDYPIGKKKVTQIITAFPNVNPNWLLFGSGEMLLQAETDKKIEEVREIDPEYMEVELVSKYAYAGYLTGYGDVEYLEMLPKVKVIVDRMVHGNYKCFEVKGDSMVDGSFESWLDGDIVLGREVKRDLWLPKLHINKCDFIIVHKDGILLKRIIAQNNTEGTITIHSLNPDKSMYPDEQIYLDDVMQIFSTVQLVKRETRR